MIRREKTGAEGGGGMRRKRGFTLIEVIVVLVIMGILAAAGVGGFGGLLRHFYVQSCEASRQEAVGAYVSDWMEGKAVPGGDNEAWLAKYVQEHHAECQSGADKWTIAVTEAAGGTSAQGPTYKVAIACPGHGEAQTARFGAPVIKGGGTP